MEINMHLELNENSTSKELAEAIVGVLDAKLAKDIKLLRVEEKTVLADYFVICCGNSSTQVRALSDEVEYQTGLCGIAPRNTEGRDSAGWIVMDYGTVLVHIFDRKTREFYNLEKLWQSADDVDVTPLLQKE